MSGRSKKVFVGAVAGESWSGVNKLPLPRASPGAERLGILGQDG